MGPSWDSFLKHRQRYFRSWSLTSPAQDGHPNGGCPEGNGNVLRWDGHLSSWRHGWRVPGVSSTFQGIPNFNVKDNPSKMSTCYASCDFRSSSKNVGVTWRSSKPRRWKSQKKMLPWTTWSNEPSGSCMFKSSFILKAFYFAYLFKDHSQILTNQLATTIGQECAEACRSEAVEQHEISAEPAITTAKGCREGKGKGTCKGEGQSSLFQASGYQNWRAWWRWGLTDLP